MKSFAFRKGFSIGIVVILALLLIGNVNAAVVTVDDDGEADYISIQAAIDNASYGDIIEVKSGFYSENIVMNKKLLLKGIGNPIVYVGDNATGITINADSCTINGFNITGSSADWNDADTNNGIKIKSNNNNVLNNTISFTYYAIHLYHCYGNIIRENNILDNNYGIYAVSLKYNTLCQNDLIDNTHYNAYDTFSNEWLFNHYSDYKGIDFNKDDIGDSTYYIAGDAGAKDISPSVKNLSNFDKGSTFRLNTSETIELYENYSLNCIQIDIEGEMAWLKFEKNGTYIDDVVVRKGQILNYIDTTDASSKLIFFGTLDQVFIEQGKITIEISDFYQFSETTGSIIIDNNSDLPSETESFPEQPVEEAPTEEVIPSSFFSGNRVWDELTAPSLTYTWNAMSFSGFYFNLDSGESSEEMTIELDSLSDRSIGDSDLTYKATSVETPFKYGNWGKYETVGFMGEKYFAGYTDDTNLNVDAVSMMSNGQLSNILIDSSTNTSISPGHELSLKDGYVLNIVEIDIGGNSTFVSLTKDGGEVDSAIVSENDDYVYETDLGNAYDVPLIAVHFSDIENSVFIEGIFQISENYAILNAGDNYGAMEITAISSNEIKMENEDSIHLNKGEIIDLMGNLKLAIADADELRFAPVMNMSEPGTYELRGTVAENVGEFQWNPFNFEGFFYEINYNITTEKFDIIELNGRAIEEDKLEYVTTIQEVEFKGNFSDLNPTFFPTKYPVLGLFGNMYVPLNANTPNKLTKLITDSNEKHTLKIGNPLGLGNNYTLSPKQIDSEGDKVWVELSKDGYFVDDQIITVTEYGGTWIYEEDIAGEDNVEIMRIHIGSVSKNQTTSQIEIDGIWLRDNEDILEIELGDSFGKLSVSEIGHNNIRMTNDEPIILIRNSVIDLAENFNFRIANDDNLRYYPFTEKTIGPLLITTFNPSTLNPESYVGDSISFNISLSQMANITWILDGKKLYTNESAKTASYNNFNAELGTHNIKVLAENVNGSIQKQWTWIVTEAPFSIIDFEPINNRSISIGESQEFHIKNNQNCTINWYLNDILVQTNSTVSSAYFTFDSYVGSSSPAVYSIKAIASNQNGTNQKEWMCSVNKKVLHSGQTWELKDGYALTVASIGMNGDKALINLSKNGELVDQHIVPGDSQYYYNRTLDGNNQVIINAYISDVFYGQIDTLIVFESIEQYSDAGTVDTDPTKLLGLEETWNLGNGYSLKVADIGENGNSCVLFLNKNGETVDKHILDEKDVYEYHRRNEDTNNNETILEIPILNTFGSISGDYVEFPNEYSLKSDVNTVDINPFVLVQSGNYWDLNDEYSISVDEISPNKKALITLEKENTIVDRCIIDENGTYQYNRSNSINENIQQIITINSSKLLDGKHEDYIEFYSEYQINSDVDTVALDEKKIISAGDTFELNEGYDLNLLSTDFNGNKAFFNLTKNEQLVDEHILETGEYYYFNKSVNGSDKIVISLLLDNVFSGKINKVAIIKEIVQNPDVVINEINITNINRDVVEIRGSAYKGSSLEDIISPNDSDFIEMNASNFAGFYYDVDEGISTETLKIFRGEYSNESIIGSNELVYTTTVSSIDYESNNLAGQYNVIGFFGEKYIPLTENTPDKIARLILDSNEKFVLRTGTPLELPDDYALEAKAIDVEGEKVWLEFTKDGKFIEDKIIDISDKNGETWTYDMDIAGEEDVVVMKVNITDIFQSQSDSLIIVEGLWLVDFEEIKQIHTADQFGKMQVDEIGSNYLKITNSNPLNLTKGSIIELTDELTFKISDNEEALRFYLMKEQTTSGTYELRGNVLNLSPGVPEIIDHTTYPGFYYDFENDVGTESLVIESIDNRKVAAGSLNYRTVVKPVNFNHSSWGNYHIIGFLGQIYFAGYDAESMDFNDVSLISNCQLSKILIDDDTNISASSGSEIPLEEGYILSIVEFDIDKNSAFVLLTKNGTEVDSSIVPENDDYVYETELGTVNDVPLIAVHFSDINDSASIKGIFQISENYTTLNAGDKYGIMEITAISSTGIDMENGDSFSLWQNEVVPIMDNIYFKVADDSDYVRCYPFINIEIEQLSIDILTPIDSEIISNVDEIQEFKITTNKICNITWTIDESEVQDNSPSKSASYSNNTAPEGVYNVAVVAETSDEIVRQTWNWTVTSSASNNEKETSSTPSSNGGSGGGGGGGGTSGEKYENIEKKEVKQQYINKDSEVSYEFDEEINPLNQIKFTALKNSGTITATVEVLNEKSSFADSSPSGKIYKQMNIWVGKAGFATSNNVKDLNIDFRVEKSWILKNDIVESSIRLCRFNNDVWNQLPTKKVGEDDRYIYFESETPGFSPFAITGNTEEELTVIEDVKSNQTIESGQSDSQKGTSESNEQSGVEDKNTPGLSFGFVTMLLACAALILRKRS